MKKLSATKDKWLHIRITTNEQKYIYALSSLDGKTASKWVRDLVLLRIKKYFKLK